MADFGVILDAYTVEPSGLGVPPYLSTYVREAYSALANVFGDRNVFYLTIDDVRWALNGNAPIENPAPLSDSMTYSATVNRADAVKRLSDAAVMIIVAGDAVPSLHLHAKNGTPDELIRATACARGARILLGPLASVAIHNPQYYVGIFDAIHTHSLTSQNLFKGSMAPPSYTVMREERSQYEGLVAQLKWNPIAEIELYRGCTRRVFCGFCNEPVKNRIVTHRDPEDVLDEVRLLYAAGVRNFRLGQQTCFFSYKNRNEGEIERLLAGIRESCPELEVLHIDNADPLSVASNVGRKIAALVAKYCTEGNCAPMGIESFDQNVIDRNGLTCTPQVLMRAIENINSVGTSRGPLGFPVLLPGLNIVYGLPGETRSTHFENLKWLTRILEDGLHCHRTNVRQARAYAGTPLAEETELSNLPSSACFDTWKAEIAEMYDQPMKERVYPIGMELRGLHSFFASARGTWHRRLGSYSIQVIERDVQRPLYEPSEMTITSHAPRYIYGAPIAHERLTAAA